MAEHLIPKGAASMALDCRLDSGMLDSWREPKKVRSVAPGTNTVVRLGCCWLEFDTCVDAARGPVTCRHIFVTGYRPYPTVIDVDGDCNITERRLGLPCPERAPSVIARPVDGRSAPKDIEGRSYAYQYGNGAGEFSSLSPGSRAQAMHDGQTAVVSNWVVPPTEWGITTVRIYRTVTGHQTGREPGNMPDTTWMLVGEVPISATSFVDTLYNEELMTALEEDTGYPPPEKLQGIVWVQSMNVLAGFIGNRIYFSRNNKYHQWPHYMDLDDNVRGLVESNGLLYVATDNRPYVIEAAANCEGAECRKAIRLPGEFPLVGTGNRRMAAVAAGAVYPTKTGMVLMSGKGDPTLLTWGRYSAEDWQALHPYTITPVMHGGKLFAFAKGANSFVMTFANGPEGAWEMDDHSELSDTNVIDAFTHAGELYMLRDGELMQWDRGEELRPHKWVSHNHVLPVPTPYAAGQMHFRYGAESIKLFADERVVLDRTVESARVFRLPSWAEGETWRIEITGTARVAKISLAGAMTDLGR